MSVEYSREQAEQVLKDENRFNGFNDILFTGDKEFLNHKFPPKIEYVGKVWKIENRIFLCNSQIELGTLHGYGIDHDGKWFLTSGAGFCCCNASSLHKLTKATPTEWMEALEKFAESNYNVGDEVRCLAFDNSNKKLVSLNHAVNTPNCLEDWWATAEDGSALLMRNGVWADIITTAKDELDELDQKIKEFTKLADKIIATLK